MQPRNLSTAPILIATMLFVAFFVLFLYTFLHETGHAIVGLLFRQTLTEFNLNFWDLSAHVGMDGAQLTRSQLAVQSAAGVLPPFLLWVVFISLIPRKASWLVEMLKLIASMAVVNTLLAWIVLPILFFLRNAPSDDVTNFLQASQMPALLLTLIAAILYGLGWKLFLSKINGLRSELLLFQTTDRQTLTAGMSRTVPILAGVMALCFVVTLMLNAAAATNVSDRFSPPTGFTPVAQIDLSTRDYSAEVLTQFSLDAPAHAGVFVTVRNIDTTYFDLRVVGPDGYSSIVLHGEGYSAWQDRGLWEETLAAGTYQVVLTSRQSPGTASVYVKPR